MRIVYKTFLKCASSGQYSTTYNVFELDAIDDITYVSSDKDQYVLSILKGGNKATDKYNDYVTIEKKDIVGGCESMEGFLYKNLCSYMSSDGLRKVDLSDTHCVYVNQKNIQKICIEKGKETDSENESEIGDKYYTYLSIASFYPSTFSIKSSMKLFGSEKQVDAKIDEVNKKIVSLYS